METYGTLPWTKKPLWLFKSYYVVWKLKHLFQEVVMQNGFKSYYVVWKQEYLCDEKRVELCLNRTMQYGNLGPFKV